jgi:hypothetical protein
MTLLRGSTPPLLIHNRHHWQRKDDLYAIPASVDDADVSGPQGHAAGVGHRPAPLVCSVPILRCALNSTGTFG